MANPVYVTVLIAIAMFLPAIRCDLGRIKTKEEYDKLTREAPTHAIFLYNVQSGCGKAQSFVVAVRNMLSNLDRRLHELDMKVKLTYADCKTNYVRGLCDDGGTQDKDFFTFIVYEDKVQIANYLEPNDPTLDDRELMRNILDFLSDNWNNFYTVKSAKDVQTVVKAYPQRDWYLCYGEKESKIGKSFCFEMAAIHRRRSVIATMYAEEKSVLRELKEVMNVELESIESSDYGLWYLDCVDDKIIQCRSHKYFMDESLVSVKQFVKMIRYPPVVEMMPDGTIPDLHQMRCTLLYYFYHGVKLRWDAAKVNAFEVGDRLRGTAIVVAADVDQLEKKTLDKHGINRKRDKFPLWKMELISPTKNKTYNRIDGCPIEFLKTELASINGVKHVQVSKDGMQTTPTEHSADLNVQDDEVESMLESQRNKSCYFCPSDFKRVTVLTDKTYKSFVEKAKVAMVLFWLNVDTSSRAALANTIEASALLDANYAPFGTVACHDWPDVCQKAMVQSWPKMMVFVNGQRGREYKAVWDPTLLANSAMLYSSSTVTQITSAKEMEKFIQGKTIPLINGTYLETITVGIFKNDKSRQIRTIMEAAKRLHGQYAFGVATGPWVKEWVNERMGPLELPAIVTHKNNDELEKAVLMDEVEEATPESIISFVQKSSRPVIANLTKLTFPSIINRKVPVITLIGSKPRETEFFGIMRNVEECLLSEKYVCVTLDSDQEHNLTGYLLHAYGLQKDQLPVVVYVNSQNGHVHMLKKDAPKKSIKTWLEHINSKMLQPSIILPEKTWSQRPLAYDYLKISQSGTKDEMNHEESQITNDGSGKEQTITEKGTKIKSAEMKEDSKASKGNNQAKEGKDRKYQPGSRDDETKDTKRSTSGKEMKQQKEGRDTRETGKSKKIYSQESVEQHDEL